MRQPAMGAGRRGGGLAKTPPSSRALNRRRRRGDMVVATVKQLCTPSSLVTNDSLTEQVAQIEDFAAGRIVGAEFFRRNYFTDGLRRLVELGFQRLAGKAEDGA